MTDSDTSNNRWAAFGEAELSELYLSLDHRLAEAESGNVYVWWDAVGDLLLELVSTYPGIATSPEDPAETPADEVRQRIAALRERD